MVERSRGCCTSASRLGSGDAPKRQSNTAAAAMHGSSLRVVWRSRVPDARRHAMHRGISGSSAVSRTGVKGSEPGVSSVIDVCGDA